MGQVGFTVGNVSRLGIFMLNLGSVVIGRISAKESGKCF